MKKTITISLIAILCLLLLGACVKNDVPDSAAASGDASPQATPVEAVSGAAATTAPSAVTGSGAEAGATPGSVIIAESSNTISDSEKQEILEGLMGEIDSALGDIDSLEDLDDSDLGTDNID